MDLLILRYAYLRIGPIGTGCSWSRSWSFSWCVSWSLSWCICWSTFTSFSTLGRNGGKYQKKTEKRLHGFL